MVEQPTSSPIQLDSVVERIEPRVIVRIEDLVARQLEKSAFSTLETTLKECARRILDESRKIASEENGNEFSQIATEHIHRGLQRAVENWATRISHKRQRWKNVKDFALTIFGCAIGLLADHPEIASALFVISSVLGFIFWQVD